MKNHLTKLYFILISFLFISCAAPFTVIKSYQPVKQSEIKKIALFPVMIGGLQKPIFPLVDAAIFNKKPNSIASDIMQLQSKKVNGIRDDIATILEKYSKSKILYGESLKGSPSYSNLEKLHSSSSLITKDPNFSSIILADGDINPFKFIDANVHSFFKFPANYKLTIINICKGLEVDAIAINYSFLAFRNVQLFGYTAKLNLNTHLYLFDKFGNIIGEGKASSKGFQSKGKDISEYELVLDDYSTIFAPLVQNIYKSN